MSEITHAGNTVVPGTLALEALGFQVEVIEGLVTATSGDDCYVAADPVAVLGLIKLIETRSWAWAATDKNIDATLRRFGLDT